MRIRHAAAHLVHVTDTPRLDAEILYAHAAGLSRAALLTRLRDPVPAPGFEDFVARRGASEPIAYIVGEWEFFSLPFLVRPPLLVPRPETEHLVEVALSYLQGKRAGAAGAPPGAPVLDLCTGTGCVAVALAKQAPAYRYSATDQAPEAVRTAGENARRHGVRLQLYEGDLFEAVPRGAAFTAIVSNPPYVGADEWDTLPPVIRNYEDPAALLAGGDGLALIRRIIGRAWAHLLPGGLLALEIGETQRAAVHALFVEAGFRDIQTVIDLGGHPRIVSGLRG